MQFGAITPSIRLGAKISGRIFCYVCLWLCVAPCIASAVGLSLSVEDAEGRPLYSVPAKNGDSFAIRYLHSVALSPVTDYFVVRDGAIWLDRTVYQDFGAGLPHEPGPGQKLTREGGNLVLSGFNQKLGSFQLRVGRIAKHTLLLLPEKAGRQTVWREVSLDKIAEPGSALTFAIRRDPE